MCVLHELRDTKREVCLGKEDLLWHTSDVMIGIGIGEI